MSGEQSKGNGTPTERRRIPHEILLPHVLKMRSEKKSDPERWVTYDYETLRSWCGPEYAHVPIDDLRLQCCNLRKRGLLGKVREGGHGASKTADEPPPWYKAYLKTEHWLKFREEIKKFWGYMCAWCCSPDSLDVHHRTYERLYKEKLTDCICLCRKCHKVADARRKREGIVYAASLQQQPRQQPKQQ